MSVKDQITSYNLGLAEGVCATVGVAVGESHGGDLLFALTGATVLAFDFAAKRSAHARGITIKTRAIWAGRLTPVVAALAVGLKFAAAAFPFKPAGAPTPQAASVTLTGDGACQGFSATMPARLAGKVQVNEPGCTLRRAP